MGKRICVAQRIIEKINTSSKDLSIEELATHVYGGANWRHREHIRQAIDIMRRGGSRLPKGWGLITENGIVVRLVRTLPSGVTHAIAKRLKFSR